MNKRIVDAQIPDAYEALKKTGIADENNIINKTFRGQISSFGAAISMGSLLSAVAFFFDKGGASVDRTLLLDAIAQVMKIGDGKDALYSYVKQNEKDPKCKENVLNAAVALKLAMNLFELHKEDQDKKDQVEK